MTPKVMTMAVSASACGSGSANVAVAPVPMSGGSPRRPAVMSSTLAPWVSRPSPMMMRLSLRCSTRYVPMPNSAAAVAASMTVTASPRPGCRRRPRRP